MKTHLRVLGIDDGPFTFKEKEAIFSGVLMRLPGYVESISTGYIEVDGDDSTENIREMIERNRWQEMLHAVLIDGAALGGFNIVDIDALNRQTGIPVITVTSERPDMESIKNALKSHFSSWESKYGMLATREMHEIEVPEGRVFISFAGTELETAREIVRRSIIKGLKPEVLRLAHMISRAIVEVINGR